MKTTKSTQRKAEVEPSGNEVAIVGIACRFPGAADRETFWDNLVAGRESIAFFSPEELAASGVDPAIWRQPNYVPAHGVLDGIDRFDAAFFGYSPREAEIIDPQQRIFLEAAWEALEDAGCDPERWAGRVGVYGGQTMSHYLLSLFGVADRLASIGIDLSLMMIGNDKDSLATRVSHKLNLRGPSLTVQTACSTSLVAVHLACQSLLAREIDLGLAGAVSLTVPQKKGYLWSEEGILAHDGHCRAFDAAASGTVFGSGVGVVAVKRLADALAQGDHVYAVVRGSAVNNDGAGKVGYTAPSVDGQAEVIVEALAAGGVDPDTVTYLEAHGTGTALGDPVEVAALAKAFGGRRARRQYCALGTVKTNVGHLEAAAGIAGLIKAALAVERALIPASLHFHTSNPRLELPASPFFVATEAIPWTHSPRRAGVSSFGFGGTNTHVVLEEAPPRAQPPAARKASLLVLSARTEGALGEACQRLARHLSANPSLELADVAHTLQVGRRAFPFRRAVVAGDGGEAAAALSGTSLARGADGRVDGTPRRLAFLFPGQGSQYPGMARELYDGEPAFKAAFDRCAEALAADLGYDLASVVYPPEDSPAAEERLAATDAAQAALFAVEVGLVELLAEWGVKPQAMIGHSIGEYVAAWVAGVLDLPGALALVGARARLLRALPPGAMLAVPLPVSEVASRLGADLEIAAVNGASATVVAGPVAAVERFAGELSRSGSEGRRLHTSHAFHSRVLDPILGEFAVAVGEVERRAPTVPYVSTLTGRWATAEEVRSTDYWARHLRQTVRFGDALATLFAEPRGLALEVGPGQTLAGLARQHGPAGAEASIFGTLRHPRDQVSDLTYLLASVGGLWAAGAAVDWRGFSARERRRKVPLPTYPFERQRFWIDPREIAPEPRAGARLPAAEAPPPVSRLVSPAEAAVAAAPAAIAAAPAPAAAAPTPADDDAAARAGSYVGKRYGHSLVREDYLAPRSEGERVLAEMWQTLLGIERVGIKDNFFVLGGNSLIALQTITRIKETFGVKVAVRAFFEHPTVEELAAAIDAMPREVEEPEAAPAAAALAAPAEGALCPASADSAAVPPVAATVPQALEASMRPAADSPRPAAEGGVEFSIFFFSGDEAMVPGDKYRLILEGARFADRHGFAAIWTPERHFHSFGGLYPNPAVLGAGLATATERLGIRAGSVVAPIHHPVRVAEEWSVVDNLSRGRVGISFASGFHPSDFLFFPAHYPDRWEVMFRHLEAIRTLWRGGTYRTRGGAGDEIEVALYPRPVQHELPIWVTCANNPKSFERAGSIGANVLSSLIGLTVETLGDRLKIYRQARAAAGLDPSGGEVTVMIHTFVGADLARVKETVRGPFCEYLRSHTQLLTSLAKSLARFDDRQVSQQDLDELLMMEFERYFYTGSLMGTPESCLPLVERLKAVGVTELGCLLDFGVPVEQSLASLEHLNTLRLLAAQEAVLV